MKKLLSIAIASAAFIAAPSFAALQQGQLGATSQGSLDINLTVSDIVQISGLSNIALAQNAAGGASGTSSACVYANGDGLYDIKIAGDGDADGANLELDGTGGTVGYAVTFTDGASNSVTTSTADVGGTNYTAEDRVGNATSASCATGNTATIDIDVSAADYQAAAVGTYTDTLVLIVSPN